MAEDGFFYGSRFLVSRFDVLFSLLFPQALHMPVDVAKAALRLFVRPTTLHALMLLMSGVFAVKH